MPALDGLELAKAAPDLSDEEQGMRLKGVILDVDGTLVLSNDAHARAWVEGFAEFGYTVPFERVRGLIGMGGDKLLPELVPGLSDQEGIGKQIAERRKQLFAERYANTLQPARGARELLLRLQADGLELAVASSAKAEELEQLLKAAQVEDLIREATTSSDAEESKPAPDIVGAALHKLGLDSREVLMLGDTPYDIQSAGGCGVQVIALRCGGFSDEQLADALAIYDDPADLLAGFDRSPFAELRENQRSS
jgi:HAD superfamily hydrolase (TIGR01509 family)